MPDTDFNVTVDVTGNTAAIATDYVTSGITNAHVQVIKLAYGSPTTATRVTTSAPLPVDIRTATATVSITGGVYGIGDFRMVNGISGATVVPLVVSGTTATGFAPVQINGYVQGITTGVPVGVTGYVYVRDGSRIQGLTSGYPVAVTGGRFLSSSTDSVTVAGTIGVSGGRTILQSSDSIRIFGGNAGETMIPVTLKDGSGNSVGSSGGALNVNIVGSGFTATVNVGTLVGICQANQSVPLFVAGATAGPAVRVKGSLGANNAVEVGWSSAQQVQITNASDINSEIVSAIQTLQNTYVTPVVTNTDKINSIYTTLSTGSGVNAKISEITRPGSVYTGSVGLTGGGSVSLGNQTLKTGVTLKAVGGDVRVRGSSTTANPYLLGSGEILFVETNNLNNIALSSTGSATLYYIAT